MTDIRLKTNFMDNIKLKKLRKILGADGILSLIRLWCYVADHRPKGILTGMDNVDIEIAADWPGESDKFIEVILDQKLLDSTEQGYKIHDWENENPYAYYSKERSERSKSAALKRWADKVGKQPACDGHADGISDASGSHPNGNAPVPAPVPVPVPVPKDSPVLPYEKIIEDLNQKAGTNFRPTSQKTKDLIKARFNEKFTLEDFFTVHTNKVNEWLNDPKQVMYLRPITLYGNKFESYLNQKPCPMRGVVSDKTLKNMEAGQKLIEKWEMEENEKQDGSSEGSFSDSSLF